jgi:HEPN domain-containing protein
MSRSGIRLQAELWLQTAREDLHAAHTLLTGGNYPQACFCAQQAAEKAVKALWRALDAEPRGHSATKLLQEFPRKMELSYCEQLVEKAALLDKFYIPTRYPNGLPDVTPGQVYQRAEAEIGIEAAQSIVNACEEWLKHEA